jgi:nicotinate-nucleotide adenylyltransferase
MPKAIKTIAYFGGAFNPPHMGHLLVATYVRACHPEIPLWIAPSARHPYGKEMAPFRTRMEWCELMAQRVRGAGKRAQKSVVVSDIEKRTRGLGRTLLIVRALRRELGDVNIMLVVGADNYDSRDKWFKIKELEKEASFFVLGRGGSRDATAQHLSIPEVSSSEIRQRLLEGQPCEGLVPADILQSVLQSKHWKRKKDL